MHITKVPPIRKQEPLFPFTGQTSAQFSDLMYCKSTDLLFLFLKTRDYRSTNLLFSFLTTNDYHNSSYSDN